MNILNLHFNLSKRIDLNKRLEYTGQLFDEYCIDYVYSVVDDPDFWSDYTYHAVCK